MPRVVVSITHRLGHAEAKRRIETLLAEAQDLGGSWSQRWTGDSCLSVEGRLNGQAVSGEVQVQDRSVDAAVTVPWTLALFAGRIRRSLDQHVRRVLNKA